MSIPRVRTRYVVLFRAWRSTGRGGRWTTVLGVMPDEATYTDALIRAKDQHTIGVWEVRTHTRNEATAVLAEWLARGKPDAMDVAEVIPA